MRKIRWGILGTARIGINAMIPAMTRSTRSEVIAIASRSQAKAKEVARQLGIPHAYGSYEDLLADTEVEAIYNPLPNHLHVPWSLKAIHAGRHVLCEKPIALTEREARMLADAAKKLPHLRVMEAFMYRFHPQWQRTLQWVREGKIGVVRAIQSFFSYYNIDPKSSCNNAEFGGGGLMDIGCYMISLSRVVFDREPQRVIGIIEYDPTFNTDRLTSALLDFGIGTATFTCSTQSQPYQHVDIIGTTGHIEIEAPFNTPNDRPARIWLHHGTQVEEILFDVCDQYSLQVDAFSQAILDGTPVPTPLDNAVANMRVIEAVIESGKSGHWV